MEYIPGQIHESFQKIHAFEMREDFNIPILKKRWDESNLVDDDSTFTLSVSKGDILIIRFFKPNTTDHLSISYTYIDKLITNGTEHNIMSECTLSREFIVNNTQNNVLFLHVTKMYERDKKIESILS